MVLRDPSTITHAELVTIVRSIQGLLYLSDDGDELYDPDHPWSADTLSELGTLMAAHDLIPHYPDEVKRQ